MSTVAIYRYLLLYRVSSEKRQSRRWGTREGIEPFKDVAEILEDTATEVDASVVDSLGFTTLDFDPSAGASPP